MNTRKIQIRLACCLWILLASQLCGQSGDLAEQTLNFQNVTATNLNQIVPESQNLNQKYIDFADFDNDGDLDCVMAVNRSDFGQRLNKLYRNDGGILNEVSGAPVIPGFSLSDNAREVFFRDFDLDGWADIVVICNSNSGTATNDSPGKTKYFRNVDGTHFVNESQRLANLGGSADDGACADLDGNGFLDLVHVNEPNTAQDAIALNNINGSGAAQMQIVTPTNYPSESDSADNGEAADMNGDGLIDLLIGNSADCFIYYNNNLDMGSGSGDFRYPYDGSESRFEPMGTGTSNQRGMFPGDFNNDGLMDFYFAERIIEGDIRRDFIMKNVGNDRFNRAIFEPIEMPDSTSSRTMKVSTSDFDRDGRLDLLVMSELRRPQIFRNVSENGDIQFVEWTPAVFNLEHAGWEAKASDILGDPRPDIVVGALQDDFLFSNQPGPQLEFDRLAAGQLPEFHASDAISVVGDVEFSQSVVLQADSLPAGAQLSVLLRSLGDLRLKIEQGSETLADLDRIGHGTDEAVQIIVPAAGNITFEISTNAISFDANADGTVNLLDVAPFVGCLAGTQVDCDPFDLDDDGIVDLLTVVPFVEAVVSGKTSERFVFEILSRD